MAFLKQVRSANSSVSSGAHREKLLIAPSVGKLVKVLECKFYAGLQVELSEALLQLYRC